MPCTNESTPEWTAEQLRESDEFWAEEQRKAKLCDESAGSRLAVLLEQIRRGRPSLTKFAYPNVATLDHEAAALKRIVDAMNAKTVNLDDRSEYRRIMDERRQRQLEAVAADPIARFRYAVACVNAINEQLAPFMPAKLPPSPEEERRWHNVPEMIQVFRSRTVEELQLAARTVLQLFALHKQDASAVIRFIRESQRPGQLDRSRREDVDIALENLQLHFEQANPVDPESRPRATPDGFYSTTGIAKAMNAPGRADTIRKAIQRLFDDHRLPDGAWVENTNPARGQAKILYKLSAVRPLLSRFEAAPRG